MELDPINFAREVTSSAGSNKAEKATETAYATKLDKTADLSQEHTNGRMFEQAVQNANKTHETSAPPQVVRYADSKVDKEARAAIDKPLILNNKPAQETPLGFASDIDNEIPSGAEALLEAFKARRMNTKKFSTLAIDLIILNGQKIDEELAVKVSKNETVNSGVLANTPEDTSDMTLETPQKPDEQDLSEISLNTHKSNISFTNKRSQMIRIAGVTYEDVIRIEEELGNNLDDTLVRDLNQIAFGREVAIRLLGQERS